MIKTSSICILFLLMPFLGFAQEQSVNPFFSYNFGGLENKAPKKQISLLKEAGYDGICLTMAKAWQVKQLQEFIELSENTADFKIFSVFVRYNFPDEEEDRMRWKEVVDLIEGKDIALWFIFGKPQPGVNNAQVEKIMREVVNYSASKKVPVALYPHSWCYFNSSEQALPMIKKINHPNLTLVVHTCHELKAGNAGRLDEVVNNVSEYISYVTIAGAAVKPDTTSRHALDQTTIAPLEDNKYNYEPFLKALKKINYKAPVGYINFGFDKKPKEYLPQSIEEWERLKNTYLNY